MTDYKETKRRKLDTSHHYVPLEGLSEIEQKKREKRGRRYRLAADAVTYGRTALGAVTALGILAGGSFLPKSLQYKTVGMASVVAGLGAVDKADGYFARKSVQNGIPITDHDKQKDPYHDKWFFHMMMGSIATREIIDRNYLYGTVIGISQIATAVRDYKMTKSRNEAAEGAEISALTINKWKTGVQNVAHVGATSPIAESNLGMGIVAGTYITSNILGIIGYRQAIEMHSFVPEEKAA